MLSIINPLTDLISSSVSKHHFLTTGFCTSLGFSLVLEQVSFGISTHSSDWDNFGTNFVINLHAFWGARSQVSSGTYKY